MFYCLVLYFNHEVCEIKFKDSSQMKCLSLKTIYELRIRGKNSKKCAAVDISLSPPGRTGATVMASFTSYWFTG
jgi:hypothetical protein